jgi:hypothetical protein
MRFIANDRQQHPLSGCWVWAIGSDWRWSYANVLSAFVGKLAIAVLQPGKHRDQLPARLVGASERAVTTATFTAAGWLAGLVDAVQTLSAPGQLERTPRSTLTEVTTCCCPTSEAPPRTTK